MKLTMNVGCIGLGHLGHTIAQRLVEQGVSLTVWNRTLAKADDLKVPIAKSPQDLIGRVDVIILNLFDSDAVESVLTGPDGLLSGPVPERLSLIRRRITSGASSHSILWYVNMGRFISNARCLAVWCLHPRKTDGSRQRGSKSLQSVQPLLSRIGSTLFYLGEPALATKMKLVNNFVLGSFMATCAEAVALGEAAGVRQDEVIDILLSGAGNSMVLAAKKDKLKNAEFSAHFSSALIYKDLHYLQDLCLYSQ